MRIAITGGTGFVGRHLARRLVRDGHEVVLIARGQDRRDESVRQLSRCVMCPIGLDDEDDLAEALRGCAAVAHCAGINREIGRQTYQRVHVAGTQNVVRAAMRAGVRRIAMVSFLRARPHRWGYHASKWRAEEIVRSSGMDCTILKCGVIYGEGDHMLDHLSHGLHTFPLFALVGFKDHPVRPVAVEDVVRVLYASLVEHRLSGRIVAVLGPEQMTLRDAVLRVAHVLGRRPVLFRAPVWMHCVLAWFAAKMMTIPLVSIAQVRILSESLVDPLPEADSLPPDLQPQIPMSDEQIRRGLPEPGPFGLADCRCFGR